MDISDEETGRNKRYSDYEDEFEDSDEKYGRKTKKSMEKVTEATYEDILKIQLKRSDAENWNTAPFFEHTAKGN